MLTNINNYNGDLFINDVKLTCVSENSIFNSVQHFHVLENFSVDIMHDLYVGVFHYNMCSIILFFLDSDVFNLETLNNRKDSFQYGESEKGNISQNIKIEHLGEKKLNMLAREMLCFVHHFGLMVDDLVPHEDPIWNCYILLVKFLDLVSMPSVNHDIIRLVKVTAEVLNTELIRLFKELFTALCTYHRTKRPTQISQQHEIRGKT